MVGRQAARKFLVAKMQSESRLSSRQLLHQSNLLGSRASWKNRVEITCRVFRKNVECIYVPHTADAGSAVNRFTSRRIRGAIRTQVNHYASTVVSRSIQQKRGYCHVVAILGSVNGTWMRLSSRFAKRFWSNPHC